MDCLPKSGVVLGQASVLVLLLATGVPAGADTLRCRRFEIVYTAAVLRPPAGTRAVEVWLPLPQTDRNQTVHTIRVEAPGAVCLGREERHGNQCLYLRVENPTAAVRVRLTIDATRTENAGRDEPLDDQARAAYLKAEPLVPTDGAVRALALEATRSLSTDREKARAIYDHVVGMMTYDKSGTGWGRGDAVFACEARRGNCTDFHALVIGMARAVGVPARFAIGLPLPPERGAGAIPGYHCWAELYVRGEGWVPVDASEAAKDPSRRAYFFGHHDENRLEFSRGRHLTLTPAQQGPPLNFFINPYAEADGRPLSTVESAYQFRDREPRPPAAPEPP